MPRIVTISFRGLCARASHGATKQSVVYFHPEGGAHTPTLSLRAKALSIGSTSWKPTLITLDSAGYQLGVWDLTGQRLAFGPTGTEQRFVHAQHDINFSTLHSAKGGTVKSAVDIESVIYPSGRDGASIVLRGGTMTFSTSPSFRGELLRKDDTSVWDKFDVAGSLIWQSDLPEGESDDFVITNSSGDEIRLRDLDSTADMWVDIGIANVATTMFPAGLSHFKHYYELVDHVDTTEQLKLVFAGLERDEWDCVPPVVLD